MELDEVLGELLGQEREVVLEYEHLRKLQFVIISSIIMN